MNEESNRTEKVTHLSDEVLLGIVNYGQVDIHFAREELVRRGFNLIQTGTDFHIITPQGLVLTPEKSFSGAQGRATPLSDYGSRTQFDVLGDVEMGMNWRRICKYVLLLYVMTFGVGFLFGFTNVIVNGPSNRSATVKSAGAILILPESFQVAQGISMSCVMALLFVIFGYKLRERTLIHGILVVLISWVTSVPLNALVLPTDMLTQHMFDINLMLPLSIVGISIGLSLRARKEIAQFRTPYL